MTKYVAILDSVGYTLEDGTPVYAARGEEVPVSGDQAKALLDKDKHPPLGAIAEEGSSLAVAMQQPIAGSVNPDNAAAHLAALASKEGVETAPQTDPAGEKADEPSTDVDPSVAFSRMAASAGPGPSVYADLSDQQLKEMAKERGLDPVVTKSGKGKKARSKFDRAATEEMLVNADAAAATGGGSTERSATYA